MFSTHSFSPKLSSSSHTPPLFSVASFSKKTAFILEADSKNDLWTVKRWIWEDQHQSNRIMKMKNPKHLRARDTCKLGYSCLSTKRCLSFKGCRKRHFPLRLVGKEMGERGWRAMHRAENCWWAASSDPDFVTLIALPPPHTPIIPPPCTFNKRNNKRKLFFVLRSGVSE